MPILFGWLLVVIVFAFFLFLMAMSIIRHRRRMNDLRDRRKRNIRW